MNGNGYSDGVILTAVWVVLWIDEDLRREKSSLKAIRTAGPSAPGSLDAKHLDLSKAEAQSGWYPTSTCDLARPSE